MRAMAAWLLVRASALLASVLIPDAADWEWEEWGNGA